MLKARNLAAVLLGAALLLPTAAMAKNGNGTAYSGDDDRSHSQQTRQESRDNDRDYRQVQLAHGKSNHVHDYMRPSHDYDNDDRYYKKRHKKHNKKHHWNDSGQGNHYGWKKKHRKQQRRYDYAHDNCRRQQQHYTRNNPYSRSAERACRDGRHEPRSRNNPNRRHRQTNQQGHYDHGGHQQDHYGHQHKHYRTQQSDVRRLSHYILREILEKPRY